MIKQIRQAKFRVWDNINKCFAYPSGLMFRTREFSHKDGNALIGEIYTDVISSTHYVAGKNVRSIDPIKDENEYFLQEFTGLVDKNKKEIYEGDIVNFIKRGEVFDFQSAASVYEKQRVWFNLGAFVFGEFELLYEEIDEIEIIGHIFE